MTDRHGDVKPRPMQNVRIMPKPPVPTILDLILAAEAAEARRS